MATEHSHVALWQDELLPHIVDRLAQKTPEAVYGLWPTALTSYDEGFRTITYAQLANVINGLAWWIKGELGRGKDHDVLAYLGPNDVRLTALVLAAVKTGHTIFLTSSRNSPAAQRSLFSSLKCQTLVTTDPMPPPALSVIEAVGPRQLTLPSVEQLLGNPWSEFPFEKTFEQGRWDPLFIIHTSGSTGMPKPLIWTHETAARHINFISQDPPEGVTSIDQMCRGKRTIVTVPPFHGAGLGHYLFYAIPFGNAMIAPAATGIVTAHGLVEALKQIPADVAVLVPSVVAELAQDPDLLEYCANHLELILYIGGDLPQAIGDRVAQKVALHCRWGASEVGMPPELVPPELGPADWHYIRFHPCVGAVFDQVTDGNYELVIRRDEALASTQPAFSIRGQQQLEREYRTGDLFERHPTVPDAWCWRARADDIIVFLNGEKTNPVSMEQHILARNHELSGALVIGSQRFQAALLIEPAKAAGPLTTAEQAALIERVWPSVDEANRVAPAHAQVEKALILVTTPDRPLIRAGKGTIQRPASLSQYTEDIEKLYMDVDMAHLDIAPKDEPINLADEHTVALRIHESLSAVTGWSDIDDAVNFFDSGMDSLKALQVTRALRRSLQLPSLALSTVYQNPTISQLTSALLDKGQASSDDDIMSPLLATYRGLIHQIPIPKPPTLSREESVDVVLTGSTGTIGTYLLRALLNRPGIGHIFCLNRSSPSPSPPSWLITDGLDDRVTILQADLAHPSLGLDKPTYDALRARIGLVIHNAWTVNFNLGLMAFRPHLAGFVNLFALSAAATHRVHFVFVSSVAAVSSQSAAAGAAPEAVLDSFGTPHASASGYARSKYLAERLCDAAARHLRVPVAVARVGQVAGAVRQGSSNDSSDSSGGKWKRSEWFPSLVTSSFHIGFLPDSLGPRFDAIDWIPSDLLADVLVDLALTVSRDAGAVTNSKDEGADVFNLRNPNVVEWAAVLPAILATAQENLGHTLEVVSPSTWLDRLEASMAAAAESDDSGAFAKEVALNPAIKLLDFYRNGLWSDGDLLQPMAIERALAVSATLRDMPPVSSEWVRRWAGEWVSG